MRRIIQVLVLGSALAFSTSSFANCDKCHEKSGEKAECCLRHGKTAGVKHAECKDCKDGKCKECCKDGQCKHEKHEHPTCATC